MQTCVQTPSPDLLEMALEDCERRQRAERQHLASMAPMVLRMQATLEALQAAGLLLVVGNVRYETDVIGQSVLHVFATAAHDVRQWAARRLEDAHFEVLMDQLRITDVEDAFSLYRHADGWRLSVRWSGPSQQCYPLAA